MANEDALKSSNGALFVQVNGPNTKPVYAGCVTLDDVDAPEGDVELIRCFDPNGLGWKVVGQTQAPPDPVTTTITGLMFKTASVLERLRCPATLYAMLMCGDGVRRDVFTNWDRGVALNVARVTNKTWSNLLHREEDNMSEKAIEVSANPPVFETFRPTIGRQSTAQTQAINDLAICGEPTCAGQCDTQAVDLCANLIAAGDTKAGSPTVDAEVYVTSDGGSIWTATGSDPFAASENISSIVCFKLDKSTTRYLVARGTTDGANPAEVAYSDDGGTTWTNVNVGAVNGQYVPRNNSMFALNRNAIWLGTDDGYVYYSEDAGESWTLQEAGVICPGGIYAIYFADDQTGFFGGDTNVIAKTNDAGATWSATAVPAGQIDDVLDVTYSGRWWVAYNDGQIWYTEDEGLTWTQRSYPNAKATVPSIRFASELCGFMVANTAGPVGTVYRTIDGGYTWEAITTPTNAGLNVIVACDCNLAYAAGEVSGGTAVVLKINAYPDVT